MKQNTIEIRVIEAEKGKLLTNGETFSEKVFLGVNDDPENWWEVDEDKAEKPSEEDQEENHAD